MKKIDAIKTISKFSKEGSVIFSSTGTIGRCFLKLLNKSPNHLYIAGSLGLTSSVGLGFAISRPDRSVIVVEGDGSLLENFGALLTEGVLAPSNFIHVVLDNGIYGSSGGSKTNASFVALDTVVSALGLNSLVIDNAKSLHEALVNSFAKGPVFIRVKVDNSVFKELPRPTDFSHLTEGFRKCHTN